MRILVDFGETVSSDLAVTCIALSELCEVAVQLTLEESARMGQPVPPLYSSGVRYLRESGESLRLPSSVLKAGGGDCAHLSVWLAAWYRQHGFPQARVVIAASQHPQGKLYHAMVEQVPGAPLECPSSILGMV